MQCASIAHDIEVLGYWRSCLSSFVSDGKSTENGR
jgi:hypothetical protein